ncbi:hypothetical protein ATANTOWER_013139 [Ataeniobius toweri]|uniref:Uncharacterized protein n=1 Tax=Ataeniobius toweri TaxID=208326 RepID=A0ABU7AAM2_9TELE|nr:hypothetical protein [Ataeniobius toweri]
MTGELIHWTLYNKPFNEESGSLSLRLIHHHQNTSGFIFNVCQKILNRVWLLIGEELLKQSSIPCHILETSHHSACTDDLLTQTLLSAWLCIINRYLWWKRSAGWEVVLLWMVKVCCDEASSFFFYDDVILHHPCHIFRVAVGSSAACCQDHLDCSVPFVPPLYQYPKSNCMNDCKFGSQFTLNGTPHRDQGVMNEIQRMGLGAGPDSGECGPLGLN